MSYGDAKDADTLAMKRSAADVPTCDANYAGREGDWGINCDLNAGHDGMHRDGKIEWQFRV